MLFQIDLMFFYFFCFPPQMSIPDDTKSLYIGLRRGIQQVVTAITTIKPIDYLIS